MYYVISSLMDVNTSRRNSVECIFPAHYTREKEDCVLLQNLVHVRAAVIAHCDKYLQFARPLLNVQPPCWKLVNFAERGGRFESSVSPLVTLTETRVHCRVIAGK